MKKAKAVKLLNESAKGDDIRSVVAQDVLDSLNNYDGDMLGYLNDVQQSGCASGMVLDLIYYADTYKFYEKHADEIDELLEEYEENTGEGFKFNGRDVRNTLAWFGYEVIAYRLYNDLESL